MLTKASAKSLYDKGRAYPILQSIFLPASENQE